MANTELNNASSPLSPVGAKIFGADASGNVGFVLNQPALAKPSIAIVGDSIAYMNFWSASELGEDTLLSGMTYRGFFTWANTELNQAFRTILNYGVNGQTTAQVLARIEDVANSSAGWALVYCGINDALNGDVAGDTATSGTMIYNLNAIYAALRKSGKRLVVCTICTADKTLYGGTWIIGGLEALSRTNAWIRKFASDTPGVVLADTAPAIADLATPSTTGVLSGCQYDGLHPSIKGAKRMGRAVASALAPHVTQHRYAFSHDSFDNIMHNSLLYGNNANGQYNFEAGTGVSGVGPDAWSVVRGAGTPTAVCSKVARTDDRPGEWLNLAITSSANNDSILLTKVVCIGKERPLTSSVVNLGDTMWIPDKATGHLYKEIAGGFSNHTGGSTKDGALSDLPTHVGGTVLDSLGYNAITWQRIEDVILGETKLSACVEYELDGWSGLCYLYLYLAFRNASNVVLRETWYGTTTTVSEMPDSLPNSGTLRVRPTVVPEGTDNMLYSCAIIMASGASGNLKLCNASVVIDK